MFRHCSIKALRGMAAAGLLEGVSVVSVSCLGFSESELLRLIGTNNVILLPVPDKHMAARRRRETALVLPMVYRSILDVFNVVNQTWAIQGMLLRDVQGLSR